MPEIEGVNHFSLTVSDIEASQAWYTKIFDAQVMLELHEDGFDRVVLLVPPVVIGLTRHKDGPTDRFDERNIGLDHISFGVENRAALDIWAAHLDELGIEHSSVNEVFYGSTLVARDPDNIQIEWFALPS